MVWGATCVRMAVACAHARPIVARLWKKYAARRKVNALSVGSSPLEEGCCGWVGPRLELDID